MTTKTTDCDCPPPSTGGGPTAIGVTQPDPGFEPDVPPAGASTVLEWDIGEDARGAPQSLDLPELGDEVASIVLDGSGLAEAPGTLHRTLDPAHPVSLLGEDPFEGIEIDVGRSQRGVPFATGTTGGGGSAARAAYSSPGHASPTGEARIDSMRAVEEAQATEESRRFEERHAQLVIQESRREADQLFGKKSIPGGGKSALTKTDAFDYEGMERDTAISAQEEQTEKAAGGAAKDPYALGAVQTPADESGKEAFQSIQERGFQPLTDKSDEAARDEVVRRARSSMRGSPPASGAPTTAARSEDSAPAEDTTSPSPSSSAFSDAAPEAASPAGAGGGDVAPTGGARGEDLLAAAMGAQGESASHVAREPAPAVLSSTKPDDMSATPEAAFSFASAGPPMLQPLAAPVMDTSVTTVGGDAPASQQPPPSPMEHHPRDPQAVILGGQSYELRGLEPGAVHQVIDLTTTLGLGQRLPARGPTLRYQQTALGAEHFREPGTGSGNDPFAPVHPMPSDMALAGEASRETAGAPSMNWDSREGAAAGLMRRAPPEPLGEGLRPEQGGGASTSAPATIVNVTGGPEAVFAPSAAVISLKKQGKPRYAFVHAVRNAGDRLGNLYAARYGVGKNTATTASALFRQAAGVAALAYLSEVVAATGGPTIAEPGFGSSYQLEWFTTAHDMAYLRWIDEGRRGPPPSFLDSIGSTAAVIGGRAGRDARRVHRAFDRAVRAAARSAYARARAAWYASGKNPKDKPNLDDIEAELRAEMEKALEEYLESLRAAKAAECECPEERPLDQSLGGGGSKVEVSDLDLTDTGGAIALPTRVGEDELDVVVTSETTTSRPVFNLLDGPVSVDDGTTSEPGAEPTWVRSAGGGADATAAEATLTVMPPLESESFYLTPADVEIVKKQERIDRLSRRARNKRRSTRTRNKAALPLEEELEELFQMRLRKALDEYRRAIEKVIGERISQSLFDLIAQKITPLLVKKFAQLTRVGEIFIEMSRVDVKSAAQHGQMEIDLADAQLRVAITDYNILSVAREVLGKHGLSPTRYVKLDKAVGEKSLAIAKAADVIETFEGSLREQLGVPPSDLPKWMMVLKRDEGLWRDIHSTLGRLQVPSGLTPASRKLQPILAKMDVIDRRADVYAPSESTEALVRRYQKVGAWRLFAEVFWDTSKAVAPVVATMYGGGALATGVRALGKRFLGNTTKAMLVSGAALSAMGAGASKAFIDLVHREEIDGSEVLSEAMLGAAIFLGGAGLLIGGSRVIGKMGEFARGLRLHGSRVHGGAATARAGGMATSSVDASSKSADMIELRRRFAEANITAVPWVYKTDRPVEWWEGRLAVTSWKGEILVGPDIEGADLVEVLVKEARHRRLSPTSPVFQDFRAKLKRASVRGSRFTLGQKSHFLEWAEEAISERSFSAPLSNPIYDLSLGRVVLEPIVYIVGVSGAAYFVARREDD